MKTISKLNEIGQIESVTIKYDCPPGNREAWELSDFLKGNSKKLFDYIKFSPEIFSIAQLDFLKSWIEQNLPTEYEQYCYVHMKRDHQRLTNPFIKNEYGFRNINSIKKHCSTFSRVVEHTGHLEINNHVEILHYTSLFKLVGKKDFAWWTAKGLGTAIKENRVVDYYDVMLMDERTATAVKKMENKKMEREFYKDFYEQILPNEELRGENMYFTDGMYVTHNGQLVDEQGKEI